MANNQNQNQNQKQQPKPAPKCSCGNELPDGVGRKYRPICYTCRPYDEWYKFSARLVRAKGFWQIMVKTFRVNIYTGDVPEDVDFVYEVDTGLKKAEKKKSPFKPGNVGWAVIKTKFVTKEEGITISLLGCDVESEKIIIPAEATPKVVKPNLEKVEVRQNEIVWENFLAALRGKW